VSSAEGTALRSHAMLSGALLAACCCWVKQLHSNREAVQHTAVHWAIATCGVGCVGEGEGERGGRVEQCRRYCCETSYHAL
jgi:hypothetical protein